MRDLRAEYVDTLLDSATALRNPSRQMLDRAEKVIYTPEQAERFATYLLLLIKSTSHPSPDLMDRVERILFR
jgi:hypothetical protein